MDKITETVSRNIRTLLTYNDKQQQDLADYLGISKSTVSMWCSGERFPRTDSIELICDFFHCTVQDLFSDVLPPRVELENTQEKKELIELIKTMSIDEINSVKAFYETLKRIKSSNQ